MGRTNKLGKMNTLLWKVLCLNLIIVVLMNLLFYPRYIADADIIMQVLLTGAAGDNITVSHLLFGNTILGGMFFILYRITSVVPWYFLFHTGCAFVSITIIDYYLLKRITGRMGMLITVVVTAFLGCECYCLPVYLKTAAVLCMAMCFVAAHCLEPGTKGVVIRILWIFVLGFLSILISWKIFLAVLLCCIVPIGLYAFRKRIQWRKMMLPVAMFTVMIVLMIALNVIDKVSYSSEHWNRAAKYKDSMEQLLSFGTLDYDDVAELLPEEMAEAQYNNLKKGYFLNETDDTFEFIKNVTARKEAFNVESLMYFFHHIPIKMLGVGSFYLWVALAYIILTFKCEKGSWFIGTSLAIALVEWSIFYYMEALDYNWMYMIALLPIIFYAMLYLKDVECSDTKIAIVYFIIASVVLYNSFGSSLATKVMDDHMVAYFDNALQKDDNKSVYITSVNKNIPYFAVTDEYPKNLPSYKMCCLDGIYSLIPEMDNFNSIGKISSSKVYTWVGSYGSVNINKVWNEALK